MEDTKRIVLNQSTVVPSYSHRSNKIVEEIILDDCITSIGERAFLDCTNLKNITLSNNLLTIGNSAFANCENIEEITIPSSVSTIGYRAFANCKRLKKIILPDSIKSIGWGAFTGCENLKEVILPKGLKQLERETFFNCHKLVNVNIPENITEIPDACFKGCQKLDIPISDNIFKIGISAFEDCYKQSTFPKHTIHFGKEAFKNCRSITNVNFEAKGKTSYISLPEGLFDGCINLSTITSNCKIEGNKRLFRNCKSLTEMPLFIDKLYERMYENCTGLTDVYFKDSIVPEACFRGCTNLKYSKNFEVVKKLEPYAFSGCNSIEQIDLSYIPNVGAETFSNCKNLKKVIFSDFTKRIEKGTFANCPKLSDITIPETVDYIGSKAFYNCKSIKSINIPLSVYSIHDNSFGYCDSLENINVHPLNPYFYSPDHKIVIHKFQQELVLYAVGSKDESYSLENICYFKDKDGKDTINPITGIGPYAFAGAKNLKELTLCSCVDEFDITSFIGCDNLKVLNMVIIPLYSDTSIKLYDGDLPAEITTANSHIPFEELNFISEEGRCTRITKYEQFSNLKKLTLSDNTLTIGFNSFSDSPLLNEVNIPEHISVIATHAFNPNTKIFFKNGLNGDNFKTMYIDSHNQKYRVYAYNNGIYYIQNKILHKITKEEIEKDCINAQYIEEEPVLYYTFMQAIKRHKINNEQFHNGVLIKLMSKENKKILLKYVKPNDEFFFNVLKNSYLITNPEPTELDYLLQDEKEKEVINDPYTKSLLSEKEFQRFIDYVDVFKKYNLTNPLFYNKQLIATLDVNKFIVMINIDPNQVERLIKYGINKNKVINDLEVKEAIKKTNEINYLVNYIKLIADNNITDPLIYDMAIVANSDNPLFKKLVKIYDSNTKRLIKMSEALKSKDYSKENFNDLLTLMNMAGALEEDPIVRQKGATFIMEKIFDYTIPNGNRKEAYKNEYQIIGDSIHRFFDITKGYELNYDPEYAEFFINNYRELYQQEQKLPGSITRIYLNFKEISKTSTSDKGSQRKLKVTIKKCIDYISNYKFNGVNDNNKYLADLIGKWFSEEKAWAAALQITAEAKNAPRNIFTKVEKDQSDQDIYDMDPDHDLIEPIADHCTYAWLPKQDYDNLVLGKYCNCCAHVNGAGQGIMRASMILDCCQNMVIRNNNGEIIAKATIYVNKNEHYAVFNTIESNSANNEKTHREIYAAFMRGTKAFLETYNANNPDNMIYIITVGNKTYSIFNYFNSKKHPNVNIYKSLQYGEYSLYGSGWAGDWANGQKLVLKAKRTDH